MELNAVRTKRSAFTFLVPLVFAVLLVLKSIDNPRLAGLRGPDVLQLIAIGMFIGAAIGLFAGRKSS